MHDDPVLHNYFVDEAGDMTLFDKKGTVVVGSPGVSKVFMVGVAYLPQPELAKEYLDGLRAELLADPYFDSVPSLRPDQKKTASAFHACKDLPEIRYQVFKVLPRLKAKVQVAIRRKHDVAREAQLLYQRSGKKLNPDSLYDDLVKRLFKGLLHKAPENQIVFARRGKTDRYEALREAISRAKGNFEKSHGKPSDRPTVIRSAQPHEFTGLQVVD